MDYISIKKHFPDLEIYQNHPLAPYTTLKIGGPADIFIHTKTSQEFTKILSYLPSEAITILGNGSNVLISDSGIRGVVIKNSDNSIEISDTTPIPIDFHHSYTQRKENEPDLYLDFTKLDYDESHFPQVLVKISSGTSLPLAINKLLDQGVTGLQWFAYIPGTIGGAVLCNIHGGSYHISDYIESVEVFDLQTKKNETFLKKDLIWGYETSFFQSKPNLIIISATLRLFKGDTSLAKQVASAWIAQKTKVQPMNSAGSTFANPSLDQCLPIWGEQKSAGWIIDHELGWKGRSCGNAQISLQHSNFIVNLGSATASDYLTLLKSIQNEVQTRFGINLIPEIKLL